MYGWLKRVRSLRGIVQSLGPNVVRSCAFHMEIEKSEDSCLANSNRILVGFRNSLQTLKTKKMQLCDHCFQSQSSYVIEYTLRYSHDSMRLTFFILEILPKSIADTIFNMISLFARPLYGSGW